MRKMEDVITVLFELPKYLEQGLKSGEYIRYGGVIRSASNGSIVQHLVETGIAESKNQMVPAILSSQGLVIGMGAVSIGVTMVGMYILAKRIKQAEEKIIEAISKLDEKIDIISLQKHAEYRAILYKAFDLAKTAELTKGNAFREKTFLDARNAFVEAKNVYANLADAFEQRGNLTTQYGLHGEYTQASLAAAMGEYRCNMLLGEDILAEMNLVKLKSEIGNRREVFINHFRKDVVRSCLPYDEIPNINFREKLLSEMLARLETLPLQIKFLKERGYSIEKFEQDVIKRDEVPPVIFLPVAS